MGRKLALWGLGIFLGLAALGGILDALGVDEKSPTEDARKRPEPRPKQDAPSTKRATARARSSARRETTARNLRRVTEVIDGDTVVLAGLGRVRLIGVDTPEEGRCYDTAATGFTRRRIGGRLVRFEIGAEPRDRYGRALAYLFTGGTMHNVELLREGYARLLTIPPNDKYVARFSRAERSARAIDRGVWGTCAPAPRARRTPRPRRPGSSGRGARGAGALPPPPPDLDCADIGHPVPVGPGDPHRLDRDGDGTGCD